MRTKSARIARISSRYAASSRSPGVGTRSVFMPRVRSAAACRTSRTDLFRSHDHFQPRLDLHPLRQGSRGLGCRRRPHQDPPHRWPAHPPAWDGRRCSRRAAPVAAPRAREDHRADSRLRRSRERARASRHNGRAATGIRAPPPPSRCPASIALTLLATPSQSPRCRPRLMDTPCGYDRGSCAPRQHRGREAQLDHAETIPGATRRPRVDHVVTEREVGTTLPEVCLQRSDQRSLSRCRGKPRFGDLRGSSALSRLPARAVPKEPHPKGMISLPEFSRAEGDAREVSWISRR